MKTARAWVTVHHQGVRRANLLFSRLVLLFLILTILAWSIYPLKQRFQQKREIRSLEKELKNTRQKNTVLNNEITRLNSSAYIEFLARKNFALVKPGEEAYIVTFSPDEEVKITEPNQKVKAKKKTLLQKIERFFQTRF